MEKIMKILVIGGSGVIGSGIVEASANAGHEVYAVSRQKTLIQKEFGNVKRICADWYNTNDPEDIIKGGGVQL